MKKSHAEPHSTTDENRRIYHQNKVGDRLVSSLKDTKSFEDNQMLNVYKHAKNDIHDER